MSIMAKQSFWMTKPAAQTAISKSITAFEQVIMDTLAQFERGGYVEKLKTNITSESLPPNNEDLVGFLYNQIAHD
jgi:hypothetical protein